MAGAEFQIAERVVDGTAVVAPQGDIDAYTGPRLAECLDSTVNATTGNITIDLAGVDFVDSSGIAVFVAAAKRLRERGDHLVVQSPTRSVTKLLEMTGVTKLVKLESGR
jgi:anti-sigma B factor antagonist